MKIQLRYKTCVSSETIQISNNSISPQLFWFLMLQKQLFALTRTQGNPKKRPGLGFSEAFEDITCVWFFFSSIRGSVPNHFNFNCVLRVQLHCGHNHESQEGRFVFIQLENILYRRSDIIQTLGVIWRLNRALWCRRRIGHGFLQWIWWAIRHILSCKHFFF